MHNYIPLVNLCSLFLIPITDYRLPITGSLLVVLDAHTRHAENVINWSNDVRGVVWTYVGICGGMCIWYMIYIA